jgi:glycosyltransferase involved in cell wall biosynthesis
VNNAIPVISYSHIIKSINSTKIKILFLSNLIISKGIYIFLDAIEILYLKKNIHIEALIIGEEAEIKAEELLNEIKKRNLDNFIKYLGPKYGEEKSRILREVDILVYPTFNDVWGLVILEAMQFGLPVIASREGAIPEIVDDGTTGFLVDKYHPGQIAEKLELLIKHPELRKEMGIAGRKKYFEKYTLDIFEKNMADVLSEVLKNHSK